MHSIPFCSMYIIYNSNISELYFIPSPGNLTVREAIDRASQIAAEDRTLPGPAAALPWHGPPSFVVYCSYDDGPFSHFPYYCCCSWRNDVSS